MHPRRTPSGGRRGQIAGELRYAVTAQTEQKPMLADHRRAVQCTSGAHQAEAVEGRWCRKRGRIEACQDRLREVYRIHGRWAAKLPARLLGIRHEAVTDMTAVKWETRNDQCTQVGWCEPARSRAAELEGGLLRG